MWMYMYINYVHGYRIRYHACMEVYWYGCVSKVLLIVDCVGVHPLIRNCCEVLGDRWRHDNCCGICHSERHMNILIVLWTSGRRCPAFVRTAISNKDMLMWVSVVTPTPHPRYTHAIPGTGFEGEDCRRCRTQSPRFKTFTIIASNSDNSNSSYSNYDNYSNDN